MNRILLLIVFFISSWAGYAQPSTQASNIRISPVSGDPTSMRIDWDAGNAGNKVVVVITNGTGNYVPPNGSNQAVAGTAFPADGAGSDLDPDATEIAAVVFNNTGTSVTVSGLGALKEYKIRIYEYTGSGGTTAYNYYPNQNNPIVFNYFTATGSYAVPTNVTSVKVQAWGGGGGGGGSDNASGTGVAAGGGGGGGAYSSSVLTVGAGSSQAVTIGAGGIGSPGSSTTNATAGGDSWFGSNTTLMAKGGGLGGDESSDTGGTGGTGGASGSGFGTIKNSGGNGGDGGQSSGGGGGSSAGSTASGAGVNGNNGSNGATGGAGTAGGAGGTAVIGGGAGGLGAENTDGSDNNTPGSFPGGGGGAADDEDVAAGANGASGLVIVSYGLPAVLSATLNYGTGVLVVTTSENISAVDPTKFHINDATGVDNVNLTEVPTGLTTNTLTFTLTEAHRLAALAISGVAGGNGGAVVVDVDAGGITSTAGNLNLIDDNNPVTETADTVLPVFSATAPATSSFRSTTQVSYTLSETISSGSITWTRTGGTADPGSPHSQALTGGELIIGSHNNITLTNNPVLVDAAVYTVTFNGTDAAGNAASTVTATSVTYDFMPPVISATAPAASSYANNKQVSYTLSENVASGSITWTRTGGNADPGSPHVQALTGTELNSGPHTNITLTNNPALVSETIYTMTFNATDAAGNAATTVTNTNITYDVTAPVFSATAPTTSSFRNSAQVSYTLSETLTSGSITWTRTGGTADPGSPHVQALTGTELNAGPHPNITLTNNPTLVNGTVYTVTFNGTDLATNPASTVTATSVTFDTTLPVISATAPASSALVSNTQVSYTLSETALSGSITWTRTGGTADPGSPHVQALTGGELSSGAHPNITLTNDPALVSGTIYSIAFNVNDLAGNAAATITNTNVTFDNTPPVFSSTAPASSSFISSSQVSYTLSETLASGTITWTRTGGTADPGSPHAQALTGSELNVGPHNNITLANNPVLVDQTIYTISFDGIDLVGLPATTVTATNVTFDGTPPVISATAPPSSSSVASTQVSYTLSENVASGSITWTRTGGTLDPGSPHVQTLTGAELNSGPHPNIILTNNPSLVNGTIYSMTYNATDPGGNNAVTITNTNITFETSKFSSIQLNSTPVPISSIMDNNGNSADVMQFTIYDDGQDPISPNVMTLHLNGASQETITFTLSTELTLGEGAFVSGFTSSTGSVADARYSDKGGANIITLTSNANGVWNASTTISYNAAIGNAEFMAPLPPAGLGGKMQSINAHAVVQAADVVQTFSTSGTFIVPAGVTKITVEAWGAGGSGGEYSVGYGPGSSGGGGGGAYSRALVSVTPGANINYSVGTGGAVRPPQACCVFGNNGGSTSFGGSLVLAEGGFAGLPSAWYNVYGPTDANPPYTYGGRASAGIGDVKYSGGQGGYGQNISPSSGGGGGSSAGTSANGNSGAVGIYCIFGGCTSGGGGAPAGGGGGGLGRENNIGGGGGFPGGGGGGVGQAYNSGAGANGQIRITYSNPIGGGTSDWDGDNAPFKFSEIKITQGAGNSPTLSNWQDIIAGAELFDGSNTVTGVVNTNDITFSSIPSNSNTDLGFIDDASGGISTKTYTLKVWLRNNLSNTLAATVDGLNLAFQLDPTVPANLVYDNTSNGLLSSGLVPNQPALESGTNQIDVVASKLVYNTPGTAPTNTNPQPQIGVLTPFSANVAGQDPEVYALDANNNLDLGYNNTANITNPAQNFGQSISSASFSAGKLLLNPFYFTTGSTSVVNTQIVVNGVGAPVVTQATSSNVAPIISSLTTVTAGPGAEPLTISSMATALSGATAPQQNAVQNFDFTITDDVGADGTTFTDNDGLPTRIDQIVITQGTGNDGALSTWTDAIASAQINVGATTFVGTVGAGTLTFGPLPNSTPLQIGYIIDGGSKTFGLKIALKTGISIPDVIDNKDFVFRINTAGVMVNPGASVTSVIQGAQQVESGNNNNTVNVLATQLDFITEWAVNAPQNYDAALAPSPTAKARDANGNLDLNFNAATTVTTATPGTYPVANPAVTVNNGNITFNPALQVTSAGGGLNNGSTSLVLSSTGLTNGVSNPFVLNYSALSDIIKDPGLTYPTNILYASAANQATNITASDGSTGTVLERFKVRDGGGTTDADGTDTKLSSITLRITNWQYLRRLALYDGVSTELGEINVPTSVFNVSGNVADVTFSGITGFAAPDGPPREKSFEVVASFNAGGVVDKEVITFQVVSVSAQGASSQFATSTPAGIVSTATGNQNKIEVVATQIIFSTPPNASISTNLVPQVTVSARDAFSNLDADYNGTITATDNTDNLNFTTTNDPTGAFSGGLKSYPVNFQFTAGDGTVQLTMNSGAGSGGGVNAGPISGISSTISVLSSYESTLSSISTPQNIDYINYQATDITGSADGFVLETFQLADGGIDLSDLDGAPTVLDDLTIGISNPQAIRKIAIYSQDPNTPLVLNEKSEQANAAIIVSNGYGTITFTNLNISAPDNDDINVLVLATFDNTTPNITDGDLVQIVVLGATVGTGSKFAPDALETGSIAGIQTSINSPFFLPEATASVTVGTVGAQNRIQVEATRLDFTTQPVAVAPPRLPGINEPMLPPVVEARDANSILDTDYDIGNPNPNYKSATISSAAATLSLNSYNFSAGKLIFPTVTPPGALAGSLYYTGFGLGTLTVTTSTGLSSNAGGSTACQPVNVIHITTAQATGGVLSSPNIAGGSVNKVIFGVTFEPQHTVTGNPKLNGFTFTFDNPISGVFKNIRVFESKDATYTVADVDITNPAILGTVTPGTSSIQVNFASGRDFTNATIAPSGELSYFLMVDVEASASGSTPPITPRLIDNGYGTATDANTVTSYGSVISNVIGTTYSFASIFPPLLVSSYPVSGQLNVDPNQPTIALTFSVPVWSLDQKITLHDQTAGTTIGTLSASNGVYPAVANSSAGLANPVNFTIPPGTMTPDHVYYITIPPGDFNGVTATDNVGIMDEAGNLFAGISYSGTLYFKTANPNPPIMLSANTTPVGENANISDITVSGATINASFDQRGRAYFLVVNNGDPAPTVNQISNPLDVTYTGTVIDRDFFDINQTGTISQFGLIRTNLNAGSTYDVWIYAENDALPTPFPTAAPYGSLANDFVAATAGPTLSFTVGVPGIPTTGPQIPITDISICKSSYQIINKPIVINEGALDDFSRNGTGTIITGVQTLNLLLPSGFEFDDSKLPGEVPKYGTITLSGSDFVGPGELRFINKSTLRVRFTNTGTSSLDNITISGLRVLAPDVASGSITRLGGNALTNFIADEAVIANIQSGLTPEVDFSNSYSDEVFPFKSIAVTTIPDNYNDPSFNVTLIPLPDPGDYGPNLFSGLGVNVNQLNVGSVPINTPFNVTLIHTDNNGCTSNTSIQYSVYDHNNAIDGLSTKYGYRNENFISANTYSSAATGIQLDTVKFDNLPSYFMDSLRADTVRNATGFIQGSSWSKVLRKLPVAIDSTVDGNDPNRYYRTYNFDGATILNAENIEPTLMNPYLHFKAITTSSFANEYYTGGSLGFVEFTGDYQSIANASVQVPLKQSVEIFLPPIPVVEYSTPSSVDMADPLNNPYPGSGPPSNKGTPVYCEADAGITLTGWPAPAVGISKAFFVITDVGTGDTLFINRPVNPILPAGVTDFTNGTLSIIPSSFSNSYDDIKINYTYQDDNSPISGSSYQIIRITPNPVADFSTSLLCEDIQVNFTDLSSIPAGFIIDKWAWDFSDPNSLQSTSTVQSPTHTYDQPGTFANVSLSVTSSFGCNSTNPYTPFSLVEPTTQNLIVGGTPDVSFTFSGVSTAAPMVFNSTSTVFANSTITNVDWTFGDGGFDSSLNMVDVSHPYTGPGIFTVKALATSGIGCTDSLEQIIVMVERLTPTDAQAYTENFEAGDGNWQVLKDATSPVASSWAWGIPTTPIITNPINGSNLWTTNLSGGYGSQERSYLYTTCFDMSQLLRPMISFNSMVQMASGDGVVLEYSTDTKNIADPTKTWRLIGDFQSSQESGVDWYNALALPSKPGNQIGGDYGWAGTSNTTWQESKHILDKIDDPVTMGGPATDVTNTVFRFSLASINTNAITVDGFALDNIRIGNRTRTVLVENFTNKGNSIVSNIPDAAGMLAEKYESDSLKVFNPGGTGTKLVKINYHVGFPRLDPFNQDNPADPSARALYYNITQTPRGRLDGFKNPGITDDYFSTWSYTQYGIRTLQLAQADLVISTVVNADNGLQVDVQVIARVPLSANTRLHVAMLEQNIPLSSLNTTKTNLIATGETDFEYVLKKMLPSAIGTPLNTTLLPSDPPLNFTFTWYPDKAKLYDLPDDLAIVAFLQNEDTKEILQSEILEPVSDPPLVTGLDLVNFIDRIGIYPNPADAAVKILLPAPTPKEIQLQMIDQMGRVVNRSTIGKGKDSTEIDTKDMAAGIYMVLFGSGDTSVFKKVMIVHRN